MIVEARCQKTTTVTRERFKIAFILFLLPKKPCVLQQFYYELPSSSSADESAKKKKWSGAAATTSGKPTVMLTGGGALGVGLFERLVEGGAVGRVLLAGFDGTVESCGGGGAGEEEDGGILLNTGLGVLGQGGGKEPLWKKLVGEC